jgi:methylated-DNA-[protein]-cysteine S-methyltransferase
MRGSDFRKQVWQKLLEIHYGHTATYGEIARAIARENGLKSMSAQAVGNAVGRNDISLIIPCHRVLGSDGSLTGYAAGTDKKTFLLELEKSTLQQKGIQHELP